MAANPKRKGMSTLPIYLPKMSSGRRGKSVQDDTDDGPVPHLYVEGGFDLSVAETLVQELTSSGHIEASVVGEMLAALPRGPQLALRHAVATAARGLASARVRSDKGKELQSFPLRGEVDQEEASLHGRTHHEYEDKAALPGSSDLVYNGESVQATFRELLPEPGKAANIVATSRSLASWDDDASAWVPQAVVAGNPVVVGVGSGEKPLDAAALADLVRDALA
jgi:hypothetical protein|tara:strand:- start:17 stop:685 length:669 start_codon:yes stop_codon:yes gene_type:complete